MVTLLKNIHYTLLPDDRDVGWIPYLWLIYVLGFVIPLWVAGRGGDLAFGIVGSVVFLFFYFRAFWHAGLAVRPYIGAITLIGMLMLPLHPSAIAFFIFAGSFCGRLGEVGIGIRHLAWIGAIMLLEMAMLGLPLMFMIVGTIFTALIGYVNIYYAQVGRTNARLKLSQQEVEHMATVAERERIARDLHDLLGHTLSVITVKAELAAKLVERQPERARDEIEDVRRISREALREAREAVSGYRAAGLNGELANARLALEASDVRFAYDEAPKDLNPATETALALVVREAVTNVIRHAHADRCSVQFVVDGDHLELSVRDNGIGEIREGGGISGMRQRITELGGSLSMHRDGGCHLVARVPLDRETVAHGGPTATLDPSTGQVEP